MRIAVANWSCRRVGGAEAYLAEVIPHLVLNGHDIGFFFETDEPRSRGLIVEPASTPTWSVAALGREAAVDQLRRWKPDLVYTHKMQDTRVEAQLLDLAPAVFFAHDYHGACISSLKTFKFPRPEPCDRRFGPACLVQYFPRRCGGLSPITMIRLYRLQSRRLALLRRYAAIVTHSEYVRREYLALGLEDHRLLKFSYSAFPVLDRPLPSLLLTETARRHASHDTWRPMQLLFIGRMDLLKGGHYFLRALRRIADRLPGPIEVVFAGDGPARPRWERMARRLSSDHPAIRISFPGWVAGAERDALFSKTDLLVVPSLWPEPFGRVGPELGAMGVPAVAYGVGGIAEWLDDGVNGYLAPPKPPTPEGLGEALLRFLLSPRFRGLLRTGARAMATRFTTQAHLELLLSVFRNVISEAPRQSTLSAQGETPEEDGHQ